MSDDERETEEGDPGDHHDRRFLGRRQQRGLTGRMHRGREQRQTGYGRQYVNTSLGANERTIGLQLEHTA